MSNETEIVSAWLTSDEFELARQRLPIVYLNLVPVRLGHDGVPTHIGLLLRATPDGEITRMIVTGRVNYGERLSAAIARHIEKDLGPLALPRVPNVHVPFGVFEFFPDPSVTGLRDSRQHAVALGYVVPVTGECQPSQNSLDLMWMPVTDATPEWLNSELSDGYATVVRMAMAAHGLL